MSVSGERKPSASLARTVRGTTPRLADLASTPESPRTPLQRATATATASSSLYSSPSGNYRTEDEYVVLEVGSRFVRGGFAGESAPRCTLAFAPDGQKRVGDYRRYDPSYNQKRRHRKVAQEPGEDAELYKRRKLQEWGEDYGLYCLDVSQVDMNLLGDKLERALRETSLKDPRCPVQELPCTQHNTNVEPRPIHRRCGAALGAGR